MADLNWLETPGLPRWCSALLAALRLDRSSATELRSLDESDWRELLDFCDRSQLTLVVGELLRPHLPRWVQDRIDRNHERNAKRLAHLGAEYFSIAERFQKAGLEHVVLKGFLQAPRFVPDLRLRMQYDLDLLLSEPEVHQGAKLLAELGLEPIHGQERFPTDHLPPMVRKTGWRWRGDYFDPEIPPIVELHFRLWDATTERFAIEGLEDLWERRGPQPFESQMLPGLCPVDQFAYSAIHALRHLLRGNLKALHVWELAHFLHHHSGDDSFWREWQRLHGPRLHQHQAIALHLAHRWFGCQMPPAAQEETNRLSDDVREWFARYAASPLLGAFKPNKDELWLHLSLIRGWHDRAHVVRRRLLPLSLPGHVEAVFVPDHQISFGLRCRKWARYAAFAASRLTFHARTLGKTLWQAARWYAR